MTRSTWILILSALVPACVPASKSLGGADSGSTGDGPESSEGDTPTTGGDGQCEPSPSFTCTVPYDGQAFGPCDSNDFDANCCLRPTCHGAEDCADGEACVPAGTSGLSCADEDRDGEPFCGCSADASGFQRNVCLPLDRIPVDWCNGYFEEEECGSAPEVVRGEGDEQFCQWIDVHLLSIDEGTQSCELSDAEPRCLTIQRGFDPGCASQPCSIGPEPLVLDTPVARLVDGGTTFEVFGINDVFCGSGTPVGDWIPADDASLGPCAMNCSPDNPCALPFPDYVDQRAQASKDAPVDDCGAVLLADPVADWQAAHDCALQHATDGAGFRLLAEGESIDSTVQFAIVGLQAESYAIVEPHADSGPGFYALFERTGSGLAASDGCTVTAGNLCLSTLDASESQQLCPPE